MRFLLVILLLLSPTVFADEKKESDKRDLRDWGGPKIVIKTVDGRNNEDYKKVEIHFSPIYFQSGSTLAMAEKSKLDNMFGLLYNKKIISEDKVFNIIGHSDSRGESEENALIAGDRAIAVYDYLTSRGIDPNFLNPISVGDLMPLDGKSSDDPVNRRVEIDYSAKINF